MRTERARYGRVVARALVLASLALAVLPAESAVAASPPAHRQHFVLVHGAWHGGWAWYRIRALLEAAGHTVSVPDLPSHGVDRRAPATVTLDDYTNAVVAAVDAAGEPVVLVGHSMGGIVISSVAEIRPHAVAKLVYLAAYLLQSGQSLFEEAARDTGSLAVKHIAVVDGALRFDGGGAVETFYGTSPAADVSLARSLIVPNPLLPFATRLTLTPDGFGSVRRFYVRTAQDHAITPPIQDEMVAALPCERVFGIRSDHSPFFSEPRKLARILLRIGTL